jgi:cellulose synthase operon protein YhjU
MGLWSAYFFAKLLLFGGGYIGFSPWLNLAFAAFTALPPQNARQRFTKNIIAVPLGIMLLYRDSWLPPITRVLTQTENLAAFSLPYVVELLGRFVNWKVILQLIVLLIIYAVARRKLRLGTFVFIAIFAVILLPNGIPFVNTDVASPASAATNGSRANVEQIDARNMRPAALEQHLSEFYAKEQSRQVRFAPVALDDQPYDIVFIHACSLSWDDLEAVQHDDTSVLKRFDIVFSSFNSAASYSGPAAIRLLRGNCGQTPHKQVYEPAPRECLVFDGLQDAGFQPNWLMNHDGHFGDFFADVRDPARGAFPGAAEDLRGVRVAQFAFDQSPIYDDYAVLSRWWNKRGANSASHVALYYNTISLHDGNRVSGKSDSSFGARLTQFTRDIDRFMDEVKRSNRRAIIVLIPEHGAAVRGDRRQIPGLREIPTAGITHVPVGIALINATREPQSPQQTIDSSTSYLAVNELLSRFIADNPFAKSALNLSPYTQGLPATDSVAENEGTVIVQIGEQYMMRSPGGEWSAWDTDGR